MMGLFKATAITRGLMLLGALILQYEAAQAARACFDTVQGRPLGSNLVQSRQVIANAVAGLERGISSRSGELISILSDVDNYHGALYEIEQVVRTLRGVPIHEIDDLSRVAGQIRNVAVYGSTNIPLYTLILHAVMPAMTGADVWFRTPAASRQVYLRLYAKLQEIAPDFPWQRVHILSEPGDTQYDYFRKVHVLGLNRKGTRFERPPSDVVLFTGNPATGREIESQIKAKLAEFGSSRLEEAGFRGQTFLRFGAGLNPVVVTGKAEAQLEVAVAAALQAIRINSSQDCIAPKFYLVDRAIADQFISRLRHTIGLLRFGERTDPSADYSALTFTENLGALQEFRERYRAHLQNPEAQIDAQSRRVDPHVFVFPYEMFKSVPLVDHYAPFKIVFTYASQEQLAEAANDPRVRERAMFATVFGPPHDKDMVALRKLFEDGFHSTILNQSIFVEESGNFPFGGYSEASSTSTHFHVRNGVLAARSSHRPLLFSREAVRNHLPASASPGWARLRGGGTPSNEARSRLTEVLALASDRATAARLSSQRLEHFPASVAARPRGLTALRDYARANGGFRVLPSQFGSDPRLWGENAIDRSTVRPGAKVDGVVLHPSYIGDDVRNAALVKGGINPLLGFGYLNFVLFSSKALEAQVADGVWPGSMPKSLRYQDLRLPAELEQRRWGLRSAVASVYSGSRRFEMADRIRLRLDIESFLRDLFKYVHTQFPEGAFVKNFDEFTTGDLGNQVTSFSQNEGNLARQFVDFLASQTGRRQTSRLSADRLNSAQWRSAVGGRHYETGTKMISKLLLDPGDLIFQQRVRIARTPMGQPREVRVDFIDGEAVHSRPRYTGEYLGRELREAEEVVNRFFARAPEALRYMSGGADVAKLEDGTWAFMEFNFGANSGTLQPLLFPIEANLYLSRLQGSPTVLIRELEDAYSGGVAARRAYLSRLTVEREMWQKASIRDLSRTEVARYFRDRALSQWQERPDEPHAERVLREFRETIDGMASAGNRELELLELGMKNYLSGNR